MANIFKNLNFPNFTSNISVPKIPRDFDPSSFDKINKYVYKWKPSSNFDDSQYFAKKEELSELVTLFAKAKAKRKSSKESLPKEIPPNEKLKLIKTEPKNKEKFLPKDKTKKDPHNQPIFGMTYNKTPMRKRPDLLFDPKKPFFRPLDKIKTQEEEQTEEESGDLTGKSLSFVAKLEKNKTYSLPSKFDYSSIDLQSDGFDLVPELLEILPKNDSQAISFDKKSFHRNNKRFKNLRKRKAVSLVVDPLFHRFDEDYVPDNNLPEKELDKRKRTRMEFSRVAWTDVTKSDIKRECNRMNLEFEKRLKLLKSIAESCALFLKKKYEIPNVKDTHSRARKIVYEMQTYWRKVDRESDVTKVRKPRDVISERKRFHSEKEVKRQSQRLEFLLRQTEIFSHFIGARMGIKISGEANQGESEKNPKEKVKEANLIETETEKSTLNEGNLKDSSIQSISAEGEKKAAKAAFEFMNRRKKETREYEKKMVSISGNKNYEKNPEDDQLKNEIDLLNPSTMPSKTNIKEPKIFVGTLKSYQLKGLNWLVNLYEHSINGILADEMGLGKTIQSIAFIAHLCEVENLWGPYLVVAPNSVVHNWCYEFEQFTPTIKVLPYWGQQKDRETLRKFWKPQFLYSSEGEFHVMVTSYSTFQTDERHFKKMRWQFIILDEAQAIKNSSSQRWKSLLSLECRNRLLLTGTPIQNSMAELWSLLHYIMPSIFQRHQDFKEWFSKNIEDHAGGRSQRLNSMQLRRLHMILKPFMLRRIKQDVEHEMAPKKEIVIKCELAPRQRKLYNAIKDQFQRDVSTGGECFMEKDLYNAVMQFRKVCNHPEIYKKRVKKTPFAMAEKFAPLPLLKNSPKEFVGEVFFPADSPLASKTPLIVFDERKLDPFAEDFIWRSRDRFSGALRHFCVHDAFRVYNSLYGLERGKRREGTGLFDFIPYSGLSVGDFESLCKLNLKATSKKIKNNQHNQNNQNNSLNLIFNKQQRRKIYLENGAFSEYNEVFKERLKDTKTLPKFILSAFTEKCQAIPPKLNNSPFVTLKNTSFKIPIKTLLLGELSSISSISSNDSNDSNSKNNPNDSSNMLKCRDLGRKADLEREKSIFEFLELDYDGLYREWKVADGLLGSLLKSFGNCRSRVETFPKDILLCDSGKLNALDKLLKEKKEKGHRVLIFSQMTKMLDILEDYCQLRKYRFLRLDGGTQITDRTIMVKEFQRDEKVFIFLLSTRAGGLGINLTAADTVIFYDNDWNPTMDAQAMDRVHRIGQKKQVTVYRIICRGTVEERVWNVAQQKFRIQKSVYSGGFKFAKEKRKNISENTKDSKIFKPTQLREMILGTDPRRGQKFEKVENNENNENNENGENDERSNNSV